ncbi:MAG: ABC-2 transporter permease [Lachnospiraceae bacterium]|nr:ABC-2 transporter permease [Lachnospiraceae bacterium]
MGGLLYKDFVSVKGKAVSVIILITVLLFLLFRVIFPGNVYNEFFSARTETGEVVNIVDTFFVMSLPVFLYTFLMLISIAFNKTITYDEKSKIRAYLLSLPIDKKKYVASKYIFVGILTYAFLSVYMILNVISDAFTGDVGSIVDFSNLCTALALPGMSLALFMNAVDIPVNLLFGRAKAVTIQTSFWLTVGFIAVALFLFGDLTVLDRWDLIKLVEWIDTHAFEATLVSVLSPVISLLFFYVSYRITAFFYVRKEGMDE